MLTINQGRLIAGNIPVFNLEPDDCERLGKWSFRVSGIDRVLKNEETCCWYVQYYQTDMELRFMHPEGFLPPYGGCLDLSDASTF